MALWRPLSPLLSFAYVPWGPELPKEIDSNAALEGTRILEEIAQALRPLLPRSTAFIRFDPPWYAEGAETPPPVIGRPFRRAASDVQPPDTVILDLEQSAESLLASMKPKWRYNIRLAEKKGVRIERTDAEDLDTFYTLFKETSGRDGIVIHSIEYYRALFDLAAGSPPRGPQPRLYIASHEGEPLAAVITLFRGAEGTYLYGASSNTKRKLMAPYLLQWTAMRDAMASGRERYDLFGIPPNDDPNHPMAGLYRFKTGFGGTIIHRSGSWDFACRPLAVKLFKAAETLRKHLRDLKKQGR
jgi:lipid II:glycine glycyltransferase (peptidoglycan interpeptide bridge formation enzyme)